MKAVMLLATSWLTLVACETGPAEPPLVALDPPSAALDTAIDASLDTPLEDQSFLCRPLPVSEISASGGRAFLTGAFWMLDLRFASQAAAAGEPGAAANPCLLLDLRDLYAKLYACLDGGSCGSPFAAEKLLPLVTPIEEGRSEVATMGGVPVEVFTTSTRMRVLLDRAAGPSDVLAVLKHLDPKIKTLPGGKLLAADAAVSTGAEPAGEESDPRIAGGCCGGLCTPCLSGQCEPRPGVIVRGLGVIGFACACVAVCQVLDELPEDCQCRESCVSNGFCDGKQ